MSNPPTTPEQRVAAVVADDVLRDTATLLSDGWGAGVDLRVVEQLRPHVARLRVLGTPSTDHPSVILRVGPDRLRAGDLGGGIGWGPAFGNEVAGMRFLNDIEMTEPFVPDVLGCDLEQQLLVTEDVGSGPSLADLLLQAGSEASPREALVEHARLLGRIAASTRERVDEYRSLRRGIGFPGRASLLDELTSAEVRAVIDRRGADLDLAMTSGLDRELRDVDRWVAEPDRWLAYTPADACPDNNVWNGRGLRLFDFGFGGLRHLALDAAYSLIPFPTCWCCAPLPADLSDAMLVAFRGEVARSLPDVDDLALWEEQLAMASAAWFSGFIAMIAERELDREKQRGPLSGREAVVVQLEAVAERVREPLPAIGRTAERMATALRARWNVRDVPTYPALRGSPGSSGAT